MASKRKISKSKKVCQRKHQQQLGGLLEQQKTEKTFVNEGPNFSYNFEKLGNYIIEAYGEKADAIKDKKHSAYVDINIIKQIQKLKLLPHAY